MEGWIKNEGHKLKKESRYESRSNLNSKKEKDKKNKKTMER
jgi:hypothetical protein